MCFDSLLPQLLLPLVDEEDAIDDMAGFLLSSISCLQSGT
jgi:hypothetical protein